MRGDAIGRENPRLIVAALLVLKDDVRKPNGLARDANNRNAIILRFVPRKAMINPLL